SHLWQAANILRGPVDAADFKTQAFPLLFFKRISDVYDEEQFISGNERADQAIRADSTALRRRDCRNSDRAQRAARPVGDQRYAFAQAPPMSMARSLSLRRLVSRNGRVACSKLTTAFARVQSVPQRQRSNPHASKTRASGSQISGYGYGS